MAVVDEVEGLVVDAATAAAAAALLRASSSSSLSSTVTSILVAFLLSISSPEGYAAYCSNPQSLSYKF